MREMDILMSRFLEQGYDDMSDPQREAFERLLDLPDQDILAWLCSDGAPPPEDPARADVVRAVRRVVNPS